MSDDRYNAFISYRHVKRDKEIAIKLQRLLETYKPPKSGRYKNVTRIKKVFRDESELPTSGDLGLDIKNALERSDFLIVVCSEQTSKSQWCMQEIDYFKQLHQGRCKNILTILVSGDPHEVFPEALSYETKIIASDNGETVQQQVEVEPLAANVVAKSIKESNKKLKTEFLRIAAPILGCSFDELYQRHQRRFVKRVISVAMVMIAFTILFTIYAVSNINMLNAQANQILEKQKELELTNEELREGKLLIEDSNNQLEQKNKELQKQMEETTRQKNIAEDQRMIAEENEQKALDNLNYANEQKALALQNYGEAKRQEELANENRIMAEENLSIAEERRNIALSSQSMFLANLSNQLLSKGDRLTAILLALAGLPKDMQNPDRPYSKQAEDALRDAVFSYQPTFTIANKGITYQSILNHTDIKGICKGIDSSRIYTISNEKLRFWNTENGQLMDEIMLNPNGNLSILRYEESEHYILIEVFDYIYTKYDEYFGSSITIGDVYLIQKSNQKIIITATYKNTKKMLASEEQSKAICVLEDKLPIYIDYENGRIEERKSLTEFFDGLTTEDYYLTGDISDDNKYLSVCEVNLDKMHLVSISDGSILKTIEMNITDSYFLSDNSLIYSTIGLNRNIYRYNSGTSKVSIENYGNIYPIGNSNVALWFSEEGYEVILMNMVTGEKKTVAISFESYIVNISPDGNYAAISAEDLTSSVIIDLNRMKVVLHNNSVYRALYDFSSEFKYYICYNNKADSRVVLYDGATKKEVATLAKTNGEEINSCHFLSEDTIAITNNDTLNIIKLSEPNRLNYFSTMQYDNVFLGDPEGDTLILASEYSNTKYVLNAKNGEELTKWENDVCVEGSFYDKKHNMNILLTLVGNRTIPVLEKNGIRTEIDFNGYHVLGSHISSDGKKYLLYTGQYVSVYDTGTGEKKDISNPQKKMIAGAIFGKDNTSVITMSTDKIVYTDILDGTVTKEINIGNNSFTNIKVSPKAGCFVLYSADNNTFFSSSGKKIAVYDCYSGKLLYEMNLDYTILDVSISGNGSKMVVASDHTLWIYSLGDGEKLQNLTCPPVRESDTIKSCSMNYEGTKVLGHYQYAHYTYVWDVLYDPEELIRQAKELIKGRVLTQEEKKKYYMEE